MEEVEEAKESAVMKGGRTEEEHTWQKAGQQQAGVTGDSKDLPSGGFRKTMADGS